MEQKNTYIIITAVTPDDKCDTFTCTDARGAKQTIRTIHTIGDYKSVYANKAYIGFDGYIVRGDMIWCISDIDDKITDEDYKIICDKIDNAV